MSPPGAPRPGLPLHVLREVPPPWVGRPLEALGFPRQAEEGKAQLWDPLLRLPAGPGPSLPCQGGCAGPWEDAQDACESPDCCPCPPHHGAGVGVHSGSALPRLWPLRDTPCMLPGQAQEQPRWDTGAGGCWPLASQCHPQTLTPPTTQAQLCEPWACQTHMWRAARLPVRPPPPTRHAGPTRHLLQGICPEQHGYGGQQADSGANGTTGTGV